MTIFQKLREEVARDRIEERLCDLQKLNRESENSPENADNKFPVAYLQKIKIEIQQKIFELTQSGTEVPTELFDELQEAERLYEFWRSADLKKLL